MATPPPNRTPFLNDELFNREWATWFYSLYENVNFLAENALVALYADLYASTPTSIADLDGTYQDLDMLNSSTVPPRGIEVNTSQSTFSFIYPGVYQLSTTLAFSHNESNSGRTTKLRLYNLTNSTARDGGSISTGRNVSTTNATAIILTEVTEEDLGNDHILQLGGGDAYSTVVVELCTGHINNVGEWRG